MTSTSRTPLSPRRVDEILDELSRYLVLPGEGVFAVSTGKAQREAATRRYLGLREDENLCWRDVLAQIATAPVAMFAIPSDNGAGIVRGAARGPEAVRAALGKAPVLDIGDVFCIPHLLDDDMLSERQLQQSRAAIFPELSASEAANAPVSPLSMAQRVVELCLELNPDLRLFCLGGDHSVSWPVVDAILARHKHREHIAIVHFDAHTDLTAQRLGVDYCFATWAYHANERLGRGGRLLQIGIRASARTREHWESTLGVRQIWAEDARQKTPEQLAAQVRDHLESIGARAVYLSNDIDGTDQEWAAACGTPESSGLSREMVLAVIAELKNMGIAALGADFVELAPGLSLSHDASEKSIETGRLYTEATLDWLAHAAPFPTT